MEGWTAARRPSGQPVDRGHQRPRAAPASRHHLSVDSSWSHRRQHDHSCAICYEAADNRRFCTSRVRAVSSGLQILSSTIHTPDIISSSPSSSIRNGTLPSATFLGGCPPAPPSSKENTDPSSRLHEPPESSPAQTSRNQLPPVRSAWRPPAPAPAPSRLLSRFGSRPKPSQGWPRPGSVPWSAPAAQPASNCGCTVPSHQIATIRPPVRRLRCAWGDTACWLACSLACLAAEVLSARPLHCSQWRLLHSGLGWAAPTWNLLRTPARPLPSGSPIGRPRAAPRRRDRVAPAWPAAVARCCWPRPPRPPQPTWNLSRNPQLDIATTIRTTTSPPPPPLPPSLPPPPPAQSTLPTRLAVVPLTSRALHGLLASLFSPKHHGNCSLYCTSTNLDGPEPNRQPPNPPPIAGTTPNGRLLRAPHCAFVFDPAPQ